VNERLGILALGLLAALLVGVIVIELVSGPSADADSGAAVAVAPVPQPKPRAAAADTTDHTDAWLATALARPLFSRDRRPTPVDVKTGGPTLTALPRLTGVIVGPFGSTAIFAGPDGGKALVVSEGKMVGPYTIEAIEPGSITVTGPTGTQHISLSGDAKTRDAIAADLQRQMPPPQIPGAPNLAPRQGGPSPLMPFNPNLRQNQLIPRAGQPFLGANPNQRTN
jgi:hypothetical protein